MNLTSPIMPVNTLAENNAILCAVFGFFVFSMAKYNRAVLASLGAVFCVFGVVLWFLHPRICNTGVQKP